MSAPPNSRRRVTRKTLELAVSELCEADSDIAGVIENYGLPGLRRRAAGFASLTQIIIEQQLSVHAARTIYGRLLEAIPDADPATIAAMAPESLRDYGLTRQKSIYVHGLACGVMTGDLDLAQIGSDDDDTAREKLMAMKGIGRWTADIYMMASLGRCDIWPLGDLALAKAMQKLKRLKKTPDAERQEKIAADWAPWRSVAARILWHYYGHTLRPGRAPGP